MQVSDIMTTNFDLIDPDTSVQDAAELMRASDTGALLVGEDDRLLGMVTDRDIVLRCAARGRDNRTTKVREVMSKKILYCFEDQSAGEALENIGTNKVRRLAVVGRSKRLVGVVSLGDLAGRLPANDVGAAMASISAGA